MVIVLVDAAAAARWVIPAVVPPDSVGVPVPLPFAGGRECEEFVGLRVEANSRS